MALVLVVDDEPGIRELLRLNLDLEGHDVAEAASGIEALDAVDGGLRPDLIILDVMMPGADGWEVLGRLKQDADPAVRTTPVLLLTARAGDMDRIRGGIEGAVRYLTKPFSVAVLRDAVTEVLDGDEAVERRRAQTAALEHLARLEKGETVDVDPQSGRVETAARPRVRMSRLEHSRERLAPRPVAQPAPADMSVLSDKQRELLAAVAGHATIQGAAIALGVSRSNVYASLRRIARRLDVQGVPELVARARSGDLR